MFMQQESQFESTKFKFSFTTRIRQCRFLQNLVVTRASLMRGDEFLAVVPQLCCQLRIICIWREIRIYVAVFEVFSWDPIHLRACGKITCCCSSLLFMKTLLAFNPINLIRRQDFQSTPQDYSENPIHESYQGHYKPKPCCTTIRSVSRKHEPFKLQLKEWHEFVPGVPFSQRTWRATTLPLERQT